jgi:cytochrome P450
VIDVRERVHWLSMHGVVRASSAVNARRGDPQARLIADPAVRADPLPFFDELRALNEPIIRCRLTWITVDHAVAHELLRSEDFRVVAQGSNLPGPLRRLEQRTRSAGLHPLQAPSLLSVEPPDHTRYRKTVSSVFTPRAIAALRDRVQHTADELLDRLAGADGVVDIVGNYCAQLPVAVISEILGVPDHERATVLQFGELAAPSLDIGLGWPQYRSMTRGLAAFNTWLAGHLEQLRMNPGDDLMSQLIRAGKGEQAGPALSDVELHAVAGLVLAAGFETTVNLLGNGIRMLMDAPDQLALLREDPGLWAGAVEEILRLDSPVQLSARMAVSDTEVAGRLVRAGETVIIYLAAANRDPAVFADPNRFDVTRPNAGRHLAFSGGRHFCLGAALARAEGEVGLRTFFDRFPGARPAGAGVRRGTRVLRGWSTLPVHLGPAHSLVG